MDRVNELNDNPELLQFYNLSVALYEKLGASFLNKLDRLPPFNELLVDRWNKAKMLGWGANTNVYDSALVIGNVQVGKECWIGPNTVLDGSGDLTIGDYCTISAGVQIYTHDNIKQTITSKVAPIERNPTVIGNNVYIAPNVVIAKGVVIGNKVIIGTGAFVKDNVPDDSIVVGQPARVIGRVSDKY